MRHPTARPTNLGETLHGDVCRGRVYPMFTGTTVVGYKCRRCDRRWPLTGRRAEGDGFVYPIDEATRGET